MVILRREWLGLAIALLFTILMQAAIWCFFLVPELMPRATGPIALAGACVVWLVAQWLCYVRASQVLGAEAAEGLLLLCEQAEIACERERFQEARDLLTLAMRINDEDVGVRCHWARMLTLSGQFSRAIIEWETILRMNPDRDQRRQAIEALEKLPKDEPGS